MADMTNVLNRNPLLLYLLPSKMRKSPSVVTSPPIALQKLNILSHLHTAISLNVMLADL